VIHQILNTINLFILNTQSSVLTFKTINGMNFQQFLKKGDITQLLAS